MIEGDTILTLFHYLGEDKFYLDQKNLNENDQIMIIFNN